MLPRLTWTPKTCVVVQSRVVVYHGNASRGAQGVVLLGLIGYRIDIVLA